MKSKVEKQQVRECGHWLGVGATKDGFVLPLTDNANFTTSTFIVFPFCPFCGREFTDAEKAQ